jgi:hypothetical protein
MSFEQPIKNSYADGNWIWAQAAVTEWHASVLGELHFPKTIEGVAEEYDRERGKWVQISGYVTYSGEPPDIQPDANPYRVTETGLVTTASRVRYVAKGLIACAGRPLAACEIEAGIRRHDAALYDDVAKKCKDYVRIILSQSGCLVKCRPLEAIPGVDKRSTFYGLPGVAYNGDS